MMASIVLLILLIAGSLCLLYLARNAIRTGWVWAFRPHGFTRLEDPIMFWLGVTCQAGIGFILLGGAVYVVVLALRGKEVLSDRPWITLAFGAALVLWLIFLVTCMVPYMRQAVLERQGPLAPLVSRLRNRRSFISRVFRRSG